MSGLDRPAVDGRLPLGAGPDPAAVVALLDAEPDAAVLWGRWLEPTGRRQVLVLRSPTRTVAGREAVLEVLDSQPAVTADGPVVGGGWVVCLGYQAEFSWARHYDHLLRWQDGAGWAFETLRPDVHLPAEGRNDALVAAQALLAAATRTAVVPAVAGTFRTADDPERARLTYLAAVEEAIGRVDHGAYYQVNLCTRLHGTVEGAPAVLFAGLAERLEPAYGAWVPGGPGRTGILSCSPELFLRVQGDRVVTAPIKGTGRRGPDEDGAAELRASAKDAAENVMITDLMRNDLSRVCRTGSVTVTGLLQLEAHPGVWHLVSTVAGRLLADCSMGGLLRATFPPGSVTGAPKSAAVLGIAALERESRGAYTGALGLVSPLAGAEFSVLIRSFEASRTDSGTQLALGVGAGITVDSVPVREWQECLDKAAPLVAAAGGELAAALHRPLRRGSPDLLASGIFDTIGVLDGTPVRLAAHLARLDRSCRELYGTGLPADLPARLRAEVAVLPGRHALTVTVSPSSATAAANPPPGAGSGLLVHVATRALGERAVAGTLAWHARPAGCWRHKWRDRRWIQQAELAVAPALPYFTDAAGRVTETSRGNIFVLADDGVWVTPPLEEDVLPGVTRRETLDLLVDDGERVRIGPLAPQDLRAGRPMFWTSSLSGAVAVTAVDGVDLPVAAELLSALNEQLAGGRR